MRSHIVENFQDPDLNTRAIDDDVRTGINATIEDAFLFESDILERTVTDGCVSQGVSPSTRSSGVTCPPRLTPRPSCTACASSRPTPLWPSRASGTS